MADLTEVAPYNSVLFEWHYNPAVGLLAAQFTSSGGFFIIVYDVVAQSVLYNENFDVLFNAQVWNNFPFDMPTHFAIYVKSESEIIVTGPSEARVGVKGDRYPLYGELDWRTETLSVLEDARGIPFVRVAYGIVDPRAVSLSVERSLHNQT